MSTIVEIMIGENVMRIETCSIRYLKDLPGLDAFYDRAVIYKEINFYSVTMELLGNRKVLHGHGA